jgi:8-oxo-dGTP pyrophosphatase MutT (NUDIX family)
MDTPGSTDVRCSTVVFRDDALLLIHRVRDGADDWTLPGGTPRPGESMAACARRETLEETGLTVEPARVALVLEALKPGSARRLTGYLRALNASGATRTAAYLGNLWRPARNNRPVPLYREGPS